MHLRKRHTRERPTPDELRLEDTAPAPVAPRLVRKVEAYTFAVAVGVAVAATRRTPLAFRARDPSRAGVPGCPAAPRLRNVPRPRDTILQALELDDEERRAEADEQSSDGVHPRERPRD